MSTMLKYRLWQILTFGSGNPVIWNILSHYGDPEIAYNEISSGDLRYVPAKYHNAIENTPLSKAEDLIEYCDTNNINIYCYDDEAFPKLLKNIYNPPSVLFTYGELEDVAEKMIIASVGTRKASKYSVEITERICRELVDQGFVIASGFALGLDSVAIRAAIAAGGQAIAVLPCGLEYDYPKENAGSKSVIARHGAVISEFLPNESASLANFRARNRILAGIALGTLVTQAGAKSGALSTAAYAVAEGRDVFCIPPHELYSNEYSGACSLLREGAIPVFDSGDIVGQYKNMYAHKFSMHEAEKKSKHLPFVRRKTEKPAADPMATKEVVKHPKFIDADGLTDDERRILEYVSENGAVLFDEIASDLGDIIDIEMTVTELELRGRLKSLAGNRYSI